MRRDSLACCFRPYFKMTISPTGAGDAAVSTCWNNIFRPENQLIIKEGIRKVWNSREFMHQRKLIAARSWDFCRGASCACDPFRREDQFLACEDVKGAIISKRYSLDYGPKLLAIIPSHGCNCDCDSCFQVFIRKKRMAHSLKEGLLDEIKEAIIPSCKNIIVSGGEPFFVRQTREFIEWMALCHPGKQVAVNTNGSLLHEFGLDRIVNNNFFLTISIYGMCEDTYRAVTKRNYFNVVFSNIRGLIDRSHKKMQIAFLHTGKTENDTDKFCEFIAENEGLNGLVRNNCYEGSRFWGSMQRLEKKYADIYFRLKFEYQNEPLSKVVLRRWYNPVYSLRYFMENR